jgi:sugar phosphate isomerase/epimerase
MDFITDAAPKIKSRSAPQGSNNKLGESISMRCGAMNFPVHPILDELAAIAALGFDYIELTLDPPQAHYSQVLRQKDDLRAALDRHRLQLICHMPTFVSLADLTAGIRRASLDEVLAALEAAAALNAEKVVVHPAYIGGMGSFVMGMARQYALDSLAAIVDKAAELDLALCLENMFPRMQFGVTVEDFRKIFARFPGLQLTLDTGHANIGSPRGKRILSFIETFPERIGHVHVSDNFGKEDNHLPIGAGNIAWPRIIQALRKTGYDETVTFEIFAADREYLKISRGKFLNMW